MVNLHTKFQVSNYCHYEEMKGSAKCQKWGGQGSLKVICNDTIRQSAYDFLFNFNRNYASILYSFRDTASYLSKISDLTPPHLHSAPPLGVTPAEFRRYLWHQKTRVLGLSCSVLRVIVCLAVLVELRLVTDRHRPIAYTALAQRRTVTIFTVAGDCCCNRECLTAACNCLFYGL